MIIGHAPTRIVVGCATALVVVAAAAGCADAPVAASTTTATTAPTAAPDAATVARVDTDYAAMMLPHHEQALLLSSLVKGRSTNPDVADLAFRIDRAQVEEVGELRGFLQLRGVDPDAGGDMSGMQGMASAATLDRLRASSGPAFDELWLDTMIAHHEGALAMARTQLAATGGTGPRGTGSASPLAEFSRTLLLSQSAEIERMRAVRARV